MAGPYYPPNHRPIAGPSRRRRNALPPIQTYIQYPHGTAPNAAEAGNPHSDGENLYDPHMAYMYAAPLTTYSTPSPPQQARHLGPAYTEMISRFRTLQSSVYPETHFMIAYDSIEQNEFSYDVRKRPRDAISDVIYANYRDLWISRGRPTFVRIVSEEFPWPIDIKVAVPSEPPSAEGQAQAQAVQAPSISGSASNASQSPRRGRTQAPSPGQALQGTDHPADPATTTAAAAAAAEDDQGVTCGDIWKALYYNLRQPIMDSELAILRSCARDAYGGGAFQRLLHIRTAAARRMQSANAAGMNGAGLPAENATLRRVDWLGRKTLFVGLRKDTDGSVAANALLPDREPCEETWVALFKERP